MVAARGITVIPGVVGSFVIELICVVDDVVVIELVVLACLFGDADARWILCYCVAYDVVITAVGAQVYSTVMIVRE